MNIISRVNPLNLAEERAKFWQDHSYNPQFEYAKSFADDELYIWGKPQQKYFEYAHSMLAKHPVSQLSEKLEYVSQEEIETAITAFNQRYHLEEPITVEFTPNLVAKCKIAGMTIHFLTPITYTRTKFEDLIRHELETHILRKINHLRQGWPLALESEQNLRRTEEGLAGLHTHLFRQNKLFSRSFLTYVAAYTAQQASFAEVFQALKKLHVSDVTAWRIAVRTKRGLRDTSQPGGLTKDITYLEGAVLVWQWLLDPQNDPRDLYLGRLGIASIAQHKAQATAVVLHPEFLENRDVYLDHIAEIGTINEFVQLV
jgi:hypothetical protein